MNPMTFFEVDLHHDLQVSQLPTLAQEWQTQEVEEAARWELEGNAWSCTIVLETWPCTVATTSLHLDYTCSEYYLQTGENKTTLSNKLTATYNDSHMNNEHTLFLSMYVLRKNFYTKTFHVLILLNLWRWWCFNLRIEKSSKYFLIHCKSQMPITTRLSTFSCTKSMYMCQKEQNNILSSWNYNLWSEICSCIYRKLCNTTSIQMVRILRKGYNYCFH